MAYYSPEIRSPADDPAPSLEVPESIRAELMFESARLDEQDLVWLKKLSGKTSLDSDWLEETNGLIAAGSINLRGQNDPLLLEGVRGARVKFFGEQLGWADQNHRLHDSYVLFQDMGDSLRPVSTFIQTQRLLHEHGINAVKIITQLPRILTYSPDTVRDRLENFENLGLNPAKIINSCSAAIGYAPESIREKLENFWKLGLDDIKIVNKQPSSLTLAPETVREKVEALNRIGLNAIKVINAMPGVLGYAPESIERKLENFRELGLNGIKIINALPAVIGRAPESICARVKDIRRYINLTEWEGNPTQLIEEFPGLLTLSDEKLRTHARLFLIHRKGDLTVKQIPNFMITPLEAHIMSLAEGNAYERKHIRKIQENTTGPERKQVVVDLLCERSRLEQRVGRKVVSDYVRYSGRTKNDNIDAIAA